MISPLFTWEANIGAGNYYLQVATDEEFSEIVVDEPNITTPYFRAADLSTNTQYWWKVMMTSDCSDGEWSEVRTFTTGSSVVLGEGTNTSTWIGPYNLGEGGSMYQYLILASEMTAAGGISGALNSLSFNIAAVYSDMAAQDFTIRLKHTTATNLGGMWDLVDFTTVYGPTDYTPIVGWNTHYFDNVFVWDGVSNILVDVCFNNVDESGSGPSVYYSQTTDIFFRYHSEYGNPDLCGSEEINWWGGSNMRPNLRIGIDLSGFFPPVLNSPVNASLCNSINPLFDWEEVAGATSYTLQLASNANFDVPIYENTEIIETELLLPESVVLNNNERYFWRVNAFNGTITSFWSKTLNFITEGESLPVPSLLNPENGVENYLTSFVFEWTGYLAASGYHLQVATDEAFENILINEPNYPGTSYVVSGLSLNTQFFWRVMMVNPCSENEWSEIRTFTTGSYFIAGTGTQYNGQWDYPAAYGGEAPGAKQQYLILADELINSGITAGTLTSIAFNVGALRSGEALQDYTICLKHTTATDLSEGNWELTGWNLVYGPVDYSPTLGWNTHLFDN
ncbi:MAG TPA: fibronectin type III domain-containing protein, partial [Candidatus Kapabacteria bacterium]|nr:fibronectin type III domain-containing protein [Candidatus Kapabacteria bacterium]